MKFNFNYLHTGLVKLINFFVGLLLTCMVIIVFCNVVFRYFLNASIAWSEEISRMLFIWLVFLGAIIAYVNSEHLGLDIIIKLFPEKTAQFLIILADTLVFTTLVIILVGGIEMTKDSFASGWVASAVPVPYGYVYLVVPISSALLLIESFLRIISDVKIYIKLLKGEN